jgi:hypothetical protein
MSTRDEAPTPTPTGTAWAKASAWVAVFVILAATGLYVFKSLRDLPGDAVDKTREVLQDLQTVAAAFRQGQVETTFISYAASVSGSNYLQFATLRQTEVYSRTDKASVLWGSLELPELVVEATAPVEYTYYLDLNQEWSFRLQDRTVHAMVPEIRFNKPAIDASEIRYEVREGSLLRDEEEAMEQLKHGLTAMSAQRAQENIALVRELGRNKTAEFVENWLAGAFTDGNSFAVKVTFADEEAPTPDVRWEG